MSAYTISKNVPLPPRRNCAEFPWRNLQIGDSFFIPSDKAGINGKRVYMSASNLKRHMSEPVRFSIRKVQGGYRAWRVEV